jgi:transposase-like protein
MVETMAKKKKAMDNLARDAAAALAAGMSYGRWKALHPYTKDKEEQESEVPEGWFICKHCGKQFKPRSGTQQRYCEPWCQKEAQRERDRERKRKLAARKGATYG